MNVWAAALKKCDQLLSDTATIIRRQSASVNSSELEKDQIAHLDLIIGSMDQMTRANCNIINQIISGHLRNVSNIVGTIYAVYKVRSCSSPALSLASRFARNRNEIEL